MSTNSEPAPNCQRKKTSTSVWHSFHQGDSISSPSQKIPVIRDIQRLRQFARPLLADGPFPGFHFTDLMLWDSGHPGQFRLGQVFSVPISAQRCPAFLDMILGKDFGQGIGPLIT